MQKNDLIKNLIQIFNPNRLKILAALLTCDDLCGCDLIKKIGIAKNLLSYHIKELEKLGLIEERRCGQRKNYSVTDKGKKINKQIENIKNLI